MAVLKLVMVPIYLSGKGQREGYDFEEFAREFTSICQTHQQQHRALAFAFILYDFEHPEIRKVLGDEEYWQALDHISGRYLTVFSFHIGRGQEVGDGFSPSRRFIQQHFGMELERTIPVVLFFQVQGGRVSSFYIVTLEAKTIESAFHEIRDLLTDAVSSVRQVLPEFRGNTAEVFSLIQQRLQHRKGMTAVRKAARAILSIQEFVEKLTGIWG